MKRNISTLDLSRSKINNLQNMGYNYCEDLNSDLLSSLQIELQEPPVTKTGLEILEEELLNSYILTYNTELDEVVKEEIAATKIVELTGFPGSGKTQISFQLCITVQLPNSLGGLEGEALYISTNYNMASHRIREMAEKFVNHVKKNSIGVDGFTVENILNHIYVFKCYNFMDLTATVILLEEFLKEKKVKLLVLDSISNPLRELDMQDRTSKMHSLLTKLQCLAVTFKFAIVLTNDYTTRIKGGKTHYTPSFGDSLLHRVNTRICLSKENDIHYAELVKSVIKPTIKVPYSIF